MSGALHGCPIGTSHGFSVWRLATYLNVTAPELNYYDTFKSIKPAIRGLCSHTFDEADEYVARLK
jgi:hypothetical protein